MSISANRVKVGVVGCGVVAAAYYLPYLMKHADLVAVCDNNETRAQQSARLFGAREWYRDYLEMLASAEIEAVFILTGPGSHAPFAVAAAEAGKHILLQKPMATTLKDAEAIVKAVRNAGVKALIEPSANSPLDPDYDTLRRLVQAGVLGDPHWFSLITSGPDRYGPGLGMNPYGAAAFFTADSGGFLFDDAYSSSAIATILGSCLGVSGAARISVPAHYIVPDNKFTEFLTAAVSPEQADYWDTVLSLPRTEEVRSEAADNVFCLYEMENGAIGCLHSGRIYHPTVSRGGLGLEVYGSEGNLVMGGQGQMASIISTRRDLLPEVDDQGWYHLPRRGDPSKAKWPRPIPGAFNYYEESCRNLLECIVEDRDPIVNVEWGRHVTEMMVGAMESARSGKRYEMSTRLPL
ncbi:MAG: Gfo/Idh/MocA family protein [Acidimicrobiales bacterium]